MNVLLTAAVALGFATAGAGLAEAAAVPKASCRPGDKVEAGLQGQVPQAERVSGAAVDGYWCNLDLLGSQGRPVDANHSYTSAWATLDVYKHCAYYGDSVGSEDAGVPKGTVVVDLSDPANPKQTGYLTTSAMQAPWESLRVNARRGLLAADRDGTSFFDVYDVSECTKPNPLFAGEIPEATGHEGFFSPDGMTYWMSGGGSIYPIDLADPRNPKQLPEPEFSGAYHGGSVSPDGKRVYLCENPADTVSVFTQPSSFTIADSSAVQARASDPSRKIGTVVLQSNFACQATYPLFYDGHPYAVQFGEGSIERCPTASYAAFNFPRMLDIADETRPKVVSELRLEVTEPENCPLTGSDALTTRSVQFAPGAGGAVLFGYSDHHCSPDRLYNPTILACGSFLAGLRVYDIRDPLKPKELAYFNMGTISVEDQTVDDAISRPVILRERGLVVWTTEFTGLHVARFAPGVLPDAGCGSRDDYYFAHYNPDSPCLAKPSGPAAAQCTGSRDLTIRIPRRLARRLRSARVLVNGKRALVLRGRALRRPVRLRAVKAAKRVRVQVVGRTRAGKRVSRTRIYDTCG